MSIKIFGLCNICERASNDLDPHTNLCPTCKKDPEKSLNDKSKFFIEVWKLRLCVSIAVFFIWCLFKY